ncbi:viroplasmin family protein, partial [Liquorilactobacillus satsumensis]|uniref:ribonuclease H1 domain-containing protein n=1 Tax=Liquorilactobacillus satsumensis TaxID=259059 RepID=UPI0039E885AC
MAIALLAGKSTGVYESLNKTVVSARGHTGAHFKSFVSSDQAQKFIDAHTRSGEQRYIEMTGEEIDNQLEYEILSLNPFKNEAVIIVNGQRSREGIISFAFNSFSKSKNGVIQVYRESGPITLVDAKLENKNGIEQIMALVEVLHFIENKEYSKVTIITNSNMCSSIAHGLMNANVTNNKYWFEKFSEAKNKLNTCSGSLGSEDENDALRIFYVANRAGSVFIKNVRQNAITTLDEQNKEMETYYFTIFKKQASNYIDELIKAKNKQNINEVVIDEKPHEVYVISKHEILLINNLQDILGI